LKKGKENYLSAFGELKEEITSRKSRHFKIISNRFPSKDSHFI